MFQPYQIAYLRERVKVKEAKRLSFLRQSVAYVLSQSARKVPHAAVNAQFDITPLVEYGQKGAKAILDEPDSQSETGSLKRAIRRRFTAFFIKAFAHSLYHVPQMNAFLDYAPMRTDGTLYLAEDINLGFTVDTKHGVMKPFVRNPHQRDLETVAGDIRALVRKARRTHPEELYGKIAREYVRVALRQLDITGLPAAWVWLRSRFRRREIDPSLKDISESEKLQPSDVLGATCTVANIGMMIDGHQTVTVIIPPEVAMFGIGHIRKTPWVHEGKVVPRYTVVMTATIDHRAFDGGEVFPFYHHLKRYLDNPELIYDWKPGDAV